MRPSSLPRFAVLTLLPALGCSQSSRAPAGPSSSGRAEPVLALVGGTVYPGPGAAPIADAVILVRGTRIAAVGPRGEVPVPVEARVLDCAGTAITAGFWNSHVHFTEPKWQGVAAQPAGQVEANLRAMLTRYGFVSVVDTGSFIDETAALRRRIESGEIRGPAIRTSGAPLFPKDGIPYYLTGSLPPEILRLLPQPATPEEAREIVARNVASGSDIIKLFTGSWVERGRVLPMAADVASAAVAEAHRQRRLVFSHASNLAGLEVALDAGVDVLAHALDDHRGLTPAHFARMRAQRMAMIPTLKLFSGQPFTHFIVDEVRDFARGGGEILFGTDVGYLPDYDPTEEYVQLGAAGLGFGEILAALTTAPAARFGASSRTGRVAAGMEADLVVLARDPGRDVRAFADVRIAMRGGRILHDSSQR